MLAENVGSRTIRKGGAETHAARDLGDHPPVGLGFARRRQERALPRDPPLGVGHGAVLLAPGGGREENVRAGGDGVVRHDVFGEDEQLEPAERLAYLARARQRNRGIGRHHPQRLDLAAGDGLEQLHRLESFARRDPRRLPEAGDTVDVLAGKAHMRRELVGEPADLAPAHGIGLAGQRERPLPAAADAAGREMAVDDGVDLVGALRRLIHALREAGDGIGRGLEELEEARDVGLRQAGEPCGRGEVGRDLARARQGILEAGGVGVDIRVVEHAPVGEMHQQAAEQRGVHPGRDGKKEVGILRGGGAARIDHDDLGAALALVPDHALEQHRMAPGGVRADQDEEVGGVEVLVAAGHGVGAEGAPVAGDRGGHAQPRVGVDISRADEALHQLVGDVIVLGQELAGEIERDRVGAVAIDDALKAGGDAIERGRPVDARETAVELPQHGMQQTLFQSQRLAERRPFGADAAEIGGMVRIAGNGRAAIAVGLREHTATHAAIWAGGAHRRRLRGGRVHGRAQLTPLPGSRARARTRDRRASARSASPRE